MSKSPQSQQHADIFQSLGGGGVAGGDPTTGIQFQKKLITSQQRENELKMNIYAYQDLVQRKDEELQVLQD